ncbi:MAG: 5-(carboxyamino)imidazole ribonucleotide synthase [Desulfurococcaceae archaeon]|nr:5-(carboxyamino)imidazole ribonucleotide synthase [Desulfurococcaceae archaeon]
MRFSLQDLSRMRIGILGGGQLGWMMILEGRRYPLTFYVVDNLSAPACRLADKCFNFDEYKDMVEIVDIVTYEFEHIPYEVLRYAEEKGKLIPRLDVVELKHERWRERMFFKKLGIPIPKFFITEDPLEVLKLVRNEFNYLAVVKQSKGGYDGKGQFFIKSRNDFEQIYDAIAKIRDVFIVEEYVDFDYEASIVLARNHNGEIQLYPPTYNMNVKGILVYNYGPLRNEIVTKKMFDIAVEIATKLNYVGVMAIEFFVKDGDVMVNEFAPRVHNTGHYTLDTANVSQFEQHIRAIIGVDLAEVEILSPGGMVNILGLSLNNIPIEVLKIGKIYWYGKNEVRRRRKMGHINIVGKTIEEVEEKIRHVTKLLYPEGVENYV